MAEKNDLFLSALVDGFWDLAAAYRGRFFLISLSSYLYVEIAQKFECKFYLQYKNKSVIIICELS